MDLWRYVGVTLGFKEATKLFQDLTNSFSEVNCQPLALVKQGIWGKVITHPDEKGSWIEVMSNAMYLSCNSGLILVQKIDPTEKEQ